MFPLKVRVAVFLVAFVVNILLMFAGLVGVIVDGLLVIVWMATSKEQREREFLGLGSWIMWAIGLSDLGMLVAFLFFASAIVHLIFRF